MQFPVILFALLTGTCHISADCTVRNFQRLPDNYNIFNRSATAYRIIKTSCRNKCGRLCSSKEFCHVWKYRPGKCQLFNSIADRIRVVTNNTRKVKIYYEIQQGDEWTKIYFVKSGSGIKVSQLFLGMTNSTDRQGLKSEAYFRSFLIDVWMKLPIKKVKLSLYKNGTEVRFVIFNALLTNQQNWFSMEKVVQSSWVDLKPDFPHKPFNLFHSNNMDFVAELIDNGCCCSKGWIKIINGPTNCPYDIQPPYPYIKYSNQETAVRWKIGYGVADALALYISL